MIMLVVVMMVLEDVVGAGFSNGGRVGGGGSIGTVVGV